MQRPPIACRRAAHALSSQPSQHIWISDDLLSRAIGRFFRHGCLHQKRTGSHVPGPLEARRRAAKRRMTVQAQLPHYGPLPPLFDFAAFFAARPRLQPTWTYEPPSFPPPERWKTPIDLDLRPQFADLDPSIESATAKYISAGAPAVEVISSIEPQEQGSLDTTAALGELEPEISEDRVDEPADNNVPTTKEGYWKTISFELEGAEAKPGCVPWDVFAKEIKQTIKSGSLMKLRKFTQARYPSGPQAADFTLWVFDELVHQEWPSKSVINWLSMPHIPLPSWNDPKATGFLEQVEGLCTKRTLTAGTIASKMIRTCQKDTEGQHQLSQRTLSRLCRLLWEGFHAGKPLYVTQLRFLGSQMPDLETRRLLMTVLRKKQLIELDDITGIVTKHRLSPGSVRLVGRMFECLPQSLLRDWVTLHCNEGAAITQHDPGLHSYDTFDNWLVAIQALSAEQASPTGNAKLSNLIRESLIVNDVSDHVLNTILAGLLARHEFEHIIDRAKDANLIPLEFQDKTLDALIPFSGPLIHQLAYQYSVDSSRSYRQNWRSMYNLYKHLQSRNLPIGPLFSKALVRVGLIQPLSQNAWVSSRRLVWVRKIVAEVEGEQVAKKMEDLFWEWRGKLILHAQQKLIASGGAGRAHVSTMKTLTLI